MPKFAPVALFVFNRPEHTRQTLEALAKNRGASETELYVFSDGPRDDRDVESVAEVRKLVRCAQGFSRCSIIERVGNLGLANSIIAGVSSLLSTHETIIVLEDDLVTSPYFLSYMNEALQFYSNDSKAFSVTGYSLPPTHLAIPEGYPFDTYAGYRCSSWSWGTWKDRWAKVDWSLGYYRSFRQDIEAQEGFSRGGVDVLRMLQFQFEGRIDSWAIRFCYGHFQNNAHCIYPTKTLVQNIGLDNSGVHSRPDPRFAHTSIYGNWRPRTYCPAQNVDTRIAAAFKSAMERPASATKRKKRSIGEHLARIRRSFTKRLYWIGLSSDISKIKVDILFANTYQRRGGAAKAAWRLFSGIRSVRPDSKFLSLYRDDNDDSVIGLDRSSKQGRRAKREEKRGRSELDAYPERDRSCFFSPTLRPNAARVRLDRFRPDLVHLHWINRGLIDIEELQRLDCPIVWTLHDAWPFTGGCHYTGDCAGFKSECGCCPRLRSNDPNDVSRKLMQQKLAAFDGLDLTIVTPSTWLASMARQSTLFSGRTIEVIPNGLDTECFAPRDRHQSRTRLGLTEQQPTILFGANLANDRRKGGDLLIAAMGKIDFSCTLLTFGDQSDTPSLPPHIRHHPVGVLDDDDLLASVYSAADLYVCASREDNLPNTVAEALACGTPCAAFSVNGLPDMITHKTNGWLATPFDPNSLAEGIRWLAMHPQQTSLRARAREKALADYKLEVAADRYAALYATLIRNRRKTHRG